MPVLIAMLRGVNLVRHNRIKMDALRTLCISLELQNPQTYIQSGNIVFVSKEKNVARLAKRIQDGIGLAFGFRPEVIVRTCSEMRNVIANNPFRKRTEIHPSKLLITFLGSEPNPEARAAVLALKTDPEELKINGREVYIYYPNGMARPKLPWTRIEKTLKIPGTGRNLNTARKLCEMAEALEG